MKPQPDPEIWTVDWRTWCEAKENASAAELPPTSQSAAEDPSRWHTVSGGGALAAHLLRQLKNSTSPTLDQRGEGGAAGTSLQMSAAPADAPWRKVAEKESPVEIAVGSVIHLHPELDPAWIFPVHAVVIDRDDALRRVFLAPFSPLSVPTCEGELATGIEDAALAVICVWNARWVDEAKAGRSWLVDSLGSGLLSEVKDLVSSLREGKGIPPGLADRVGARVVHPDDPRQDYLDEMEDLLGAIGVTG